MPKSVAGSQVAERFADDAAEHGTHHTARQWALRDAGRPQIDIVWRVVDAAEMVHCFVGERLVQLLPRFGTLQSAVP